MILPFVLRVPPAGDGKGRKPPPPARPKPRERPPAALIITTSPCSVTGTGPFAWAGLPAAGAKGSPKVPTFPHTPLNAPRSSPNWPPVNQSQFRARFIPARAGNTSRWPSMRSRHTVHPRACGEHGRKLQEAGSGYGSSPRVRGTRYVRLLFDPGRFIPARAGNTTAKPRRPTRPTVHPRACGEHRTSTRIRLRLRFIPARAGNTLNRDLSLRPGTVHPRACGEHVVRVGHVCIRSGSSPRVRGTLRFTVICVSVRRFIPARAGNT